LFHVKQFVHLMGGTRGGGRAPLRRTSGSRLTADPWYWRACGGPTFLGRKWWVLRGRVGGCSTNAVVCGAGRGHKSWSFEKSWGGFPGRRGSRRGEAKRQALGEAAAWGDGPGTGDIRRRAAGPQSAGRAGAAGIPGKMRVFCGLGSSSRSIIPDGLAHFQQQSWKIFSSQARR
jgi:hypothetical protein